MTSLVAYALRPEFGPNADPPLAAASTSLPDGTLIDLVALVGGDTQDVAGLYSADGVVVADANVEQALVGQLDASLIFDRVEVPDGYEAVGVEVVPPSLAGLSGDANSGAPVDAFGDPIADPAAADDGTDTLGARQRDAAADAPTDTVPPVLDPLGASRVELQAALAAANLDTSGSIADLRTRLTEHQAAAPADAPTTDGTEG